MVYLIRNNGFFKKKRTAVAVHFGFVAVAGRFFALAANKFPWFFGYVHFLYFPAFGTRTPRVFSFVVAPAANCFA
jgi:hypothetical protein